MLHPELISYCSVGRNENWVNKDKERWLIALLAVSIFLFLFGYSICGVAYYYYAPNPGCHLNIAFITITLILTIGCAVTSMLPAVEHGSLLPSAIITAFASYTTLTALASEGDVSCNTLSDSFNDKSVSQMVVGGIITLISVGYSVYKAGTTSGSFSVLDDEEDEPDPDADVNGYTKVDLSLFIFLPPISFCSIERSNSLLQSNVMHYPRLLLSLHICARVRACVCVCVCVFN